MRASHTAPAPPPANTTPGSPAGSASTTHEASDPTVPNPTTSSPGPTEAAKHPKTGGPSAADATKQQATKDHTRPEPNQPASSSRPATGDPWGRPKGRCRMPSTYATQTRRVRDAAVVLNDYKTSRGCIDCGFARWPEALQFDHIDPRTKLRALGRVRDRSKLTTRTRLRAYLAHVEEYCEVRCANCHAHRTMSERHHLSPRGVLPHLGDTLF